MIITINACTLSGCFSVTRYRLETLVLISSCRQPKLGDRCCSMSSHLRVRLQIASRWVISLSAVSIGFTLNVTVISSTATWTKTRDVPAQTYRCTFTQAEITQATFCRSVHKIRCSNNTSLTTKSSWVHEKTTYRYRHNTRKHLSKSHTTVQACQGSLSQSDNATNRQCCISNTKARYRNVSYLCSWCSQFWDQLIK